MALDSFFNLMNRDGFAQWTIHARYNAKQGYVETSLPHEFADGRHFLRQFVPPLICQLPSQGSESYFNFELKPSSYQTRFQVYLEHLLVNGYLSNVKTIALAVDLSKLRLPSVMNQFNQVSFPVFQKHNLL
jgi:hypothetical protein